MQSERRNRFVAATIRLISGMVLLSLALWLWADCLALRQRNHAPAPIPQYVEDGTMAARPSSSWPTSAGTQRSERSLAGLRDELLLAGFPLEVVALVMADQIERTLESPEVGPAFCEDCPPAASLAGRLRFLEKYEGLQLLLTNVPASVVPKDYLRLEVRLQAERSFVENELRKNAVALAGLNWEERQQRLRDIDESWIATLRTILSNRDAETFLMERTPYAGAMYQDLQFMELSEQEFRAIWRVRQAYAEYYHDSVGRVLKEIDGKQIRQARAEADQRLRSIWPEERHATYEYRRDNSLSRLYRNLVMRGSPAPSAEAVELYRNLRSETGRAAVRERLGEEEYGRFMEFYNDRGNQAARNAVRRDAQ